MTTEKKGSLVFSQDVLRSFVIGSFGYIVLFFLTAVSNIPEAHVNMRRYPYLIVFYFSFLNATMTYIALRFGISLWDRLVLATVISTLILWTILHHNPSLYSFRTHLRWKMHYISVLLSHAFIFLVVIYNLERALNCN